MSYATKAPVPTRYNSGCVYDSFRNKVVVFSGTTFQPGYNNLADTWEFDVAAKTWALISTTHRPAGRTGFGLSYDPVHKVVVFFGGWHGVSGTGTSDTWTYDGTDWTQQNADGAGGVPDRKNDCSLTYDSFRGKHYLYGGGDGYNDATSALWEYDVGANTWTQRYPSGGGPGNREQHVQIYDANRKKLIVSGGMADFYNNFYNDVWEWDPNSGGSGSWSQIIQNRNGAGSYTGNSASSTTWPSQPNIQACAPYTNDAGYACAADMDYLGTILQWSGTAWNQTGGFTAAADYYIGNGALYGMALQQYGAYCGDANGLYCYGGAGYTAGSFWNYDFTSGLWSSLSWPQPRTGAASCYDSDHDRIWLIGGYTTGVTGDGDSYLQDLWSYGVSQNQWTGVPAPQLMSNAPQPSRDIACCYAPAFSTHGHQVILFGGVDGSTDYGDTWAIDTNANSASLVLSAGSGGSPSNRFAGTMVWDPDNNVALLVGGRSYSGTFYADVYQYDPVANSWSNRSPTGIGSFTARRSPAVVYDAATHKFIIFGGINSSGVGLSDTWILDNTANTITQATPTTSPVVTGGHVAPSYGSFGGTVQILDPESSGSVWEWSDAGSGSWTQTTAYNTSGFPVTSSTRASCASNPTTGVWYHLAGEAAAGVANTSIWSIDATAHKWVTLPYTAPPPPTTTTAPPYVAPSVTKGRQLALDPITHDFMLVRGQLQMVDGTPSVTQAVKCALLAFQGEWFLDTTLGMPYYQLVLKKNPDPAVLRSTFAAAIEGVVGVDSVVSLDLQYVRATRSLAVVWSASTNLGALITGAQQLS